VIKKIAERLHDAVAVTDADGRILFVNNVWAMLHGYSAEELAGIIAGRLSHKWQTDTSCSSRRRLCERHQN